MLWLPWRSLDMGLAAATWLQRPKVGITNKRMCMSLCSKGSLTLSKIVLFLTSDLLQVGESGNLK